MSPRKFTVIIEIQCNRCGGSDLINPDDSSDDPILVCAKCGNTIGPEKSVFSAIEGGAHTAINAHVVRRVIDRD